MKKPDIYQELGGRRVLRQGKFEVRQDKPATASEKVAHTGAKLGAFICSFEVGAYDAKFPLVIDPVLVYSTYLGGSGENEASAIAVDGSGNAYVTGLTSSTDFPISNSALQSTNGGSVCNAFVTEMAAGGQGLVYSTYFGGSYEDTAFGIAVDNSGNAYIAGLTESADFPTTANALYSSLNGPADAFVTEIAAGGQSLVYSTYLGGSGYDAAFSIAVDSSGNAYVAGETLSTDFHTTSNAYQSTYAGGTNHGDAFVTEIAAGGTSLLYSTYLGGTGDDVANSIAVDSSGNAYVAGWTLSTNFPTTSSAFQPSFAGATNYGNAFVAEIASGGQSLVYSTYLGGSGDDVAYGIAVDGPGNAYVTGLTRIGRLSHPVSSLLRASLEVRTPL